MVLILGSLFYYAPLHDPVLRKDPRCFIKLRIQLVFDDCNYSWFRIWSTTVKISRISRIESVRMNTFSQNSNFQTYKNQRIRLNDFLAENISFKNRKIHEPKMSNFDPPFLDIFMSAKNVHFALCARKF